LLYYISKLCIVNLKVLVEKSIRERFVCLFVSISDKENLGKEMKKPWAGRFKVKTSKSVEHFTESISFDNRLWRYDIEGSVAHAKMLGKQGIITEKDSERIIKGLQEITKEIEEGRLKFREDLEDIHMNIEAALIKKIGEVGGKLHTGRSRNDQVALDLRLYLRDETGEILLFIKRFQRTLLDIAAKHINSLMPGYTHLQRAQPVLLSHHLLAYVEMLERDKERLKDTLKRINILPLGSSAIAGTILPIDRLSVARLLGFDGISQNSIDAVSDRDFVVEFLSHAALLIMHLSRLAEELVLWSTEEFRFIEMPEAFTTGSSAMPQKKNPDVAELIRGKAGRIYGNLFSLLTIMKGLPLSYNRDLQEDKPPLFDTVDTVKSCLDVLNEMLPGVIFNIKRMHETAVEGYSTATDIAEYLVKKGLPFRKAHELTGRIVLHCIEKKKKLEELTLKELNKFSKLISDDIYPFLKPEESVRGKKSTGSTSPVEVRKQIKKWMRRHGDTETR
jgi:argininosuccinate lyase